MPELSEGDTIALQGEVALVHDDDGLLCACTDMTCPLPYGSSISTSSSKNERAREGPAGRWATFRTSIRNARSAQGSQPAVTFSRERE